MKDLNNLHNIDEDELNKEGLNLEKDLYSQKKKLVFPFIILGIIAIITVFVTSYTFLKICSIQKDTSTKDYKYDQKGQIMKLIDERFLYTDDVDKKAIETLEPEKMLEMLKDPYSEYLDKEELRILNEELNGKFFGIGVKFSKGESGRLVVREFLEGSSAKEQGVEVGDELTRVEGEDATINNVKDFEKYIRKIRGEKNTTVRLEFYRSSTVETLEKNIPRKEVKISSIEGKIIEDGIGYIKISEFIDSTDEDFEKKVGELRSKGAKAFILDLRDNPGGAVLTTTNMLDLILPEGRVLYSKNNKGIDRQWYSDEENKMNEKMVVLINENSASASEIFAGAMQDFGKAKIVGKKSYGKGVIQQIFRLSDGGAVKLTVSEYFTPKDQRINKRGVIPDIEVELTTGSDSQLERAIQELRSEH